jgi:plastocyanin
MRKASLALVLGAAVVFALVAGTTAARATSSKTIWVYRSMFTPSMSTVGSGVRVTLVNQDSISHRIVLDRNSVPTGFTVTLYPGQWYTSPSTLTCSGTCSSATYTYRDADLSHVDSTGYCTTFCARVTVYNNGT